MHDVEQSILEMEAELRKVAVQIWLDASQPAASSSSSMSKRRMRRPSDRRMQSAETSQAA
jgi:hypothetical protein